MAYLEEFRPVEASFREYEYRDFMLLFPFHMDED